MRLGSTALATGRVERRLAAILAADVAGYSRLMGADEEGTLDRLKALRRELSDPKIKEHRGRIVKTTGDGLLIEFASVVDAVRCAVEVQREMADRNGDMPSDRRIEFRMGINLGDIIKDGRDIYGDGVNVAARLEALAEPGGICVSRVVRDQVRDKLAFSFEDMGEQQVKNIARPVRVHRIVLGEKPVSPEPATGTLRRAIEFDPHYASALASAAFCHMRLHLSGWSKDLTKTSTRGSVWRVGQFRSPVTIRASSPGQHTCSLTSARTSTPRFN